MSEQRPRVLSDGGATPTVGVIGVGNIGKPILEQIAPSYETVVYDRDEKRVAAAIGENGIVAKDSREVGDLADVVLLSLPSSGAVESVSLGENGVLAGLSAGDVLVDTSTIDPTVTEAVMSACDTCGVDFLDAPVSGGPRNADEGKLTTIVGGDTETVDRIRPIFSCYSQRIFHVGDRGTGVAMKLANNYMFGVNTAVVCEALTMARRAGIDDETFFEVASEASGDSYALRRNVDGFVLPDDYTPEASVSILRKDLQLAERYGSDLDAPLVVGGSTSSVFCLAENRGLADRDLAAVLALYDETESVEPE